MLYILYLDIAIRNYIFRQWWDFRPHKYISIVSDDSSDWEGGRRNLSFPRRTLNLAERALLHR